jgi:alpha-glucosidase
MAHWWQEGVVYQIYPRSFKDTTGNGVGDLNGIIEKLDYLNDGTEQSLGVDAIWISPFYPSPMADFGYDVSDYRDIHPLFGTLDDFDRLVEAAHQRNIRIIVDYVPNHSSDEHPWFLESRSSRDNPKRDWYIWRDPKPDGSAPNNWGSCFGGPAWAWDEQTQQYYYHQFALEQVDLNWRNPEVYAEMMDVLRFWLERGVDGFRMDMVGMIMKHPDMPDQPDDPNAPPDLPPNDIYHRQLHIYDQDHEDIHGVMQDFRRLIDSYGDKCAIGELWYELPSWVKYYGENGDGLHLPFNFRLLLSPWDADAFEQSVNELEAALPPFGWPNYVLANHDMGHIASRFGEGAARVAAMLLLTLRGTPTLYYGDEIGMKDVPIPAEKVQDPQGVNMGAALSRDPYRTPMQWDDSEYAGFSTVEPWLPVADDYRTNNVETARSDEGSIYHLYRRLIWYRKRTPALNMGSYQPMTSVEGCYVYSRGEGESRHVVALNFTGEPRQVTLHDRGQIVISTHLDREETVEPGALDLRPYEGVVIALS